MCVFICRHSKSIFASVILVCIVFCNWLFWVHDPPKVTKKCEDQYLEFDECQAFYVLPNSTEEFLVSERMCCKHVCRQSYAKKEDETDYQCVFDESFQQSPTNYKVPLAFETSPNIYLNYGCTFIKGCVHDPNAERSSIGDAIHYYFECFDQIFECSVPCNELSTPPTQLRVVYSYFLLVFALFLHTVTLVAFICVPRLRAGYGRAVMSYVVAQMMRKSSIIVMMTALCDIHSYQKVSIYGVSHLATDLSAHVWQIVITYQIWTAFKRSNKLKAPEMTTKQFIVISALGWGGPVVLVAVYFYLSYLFLQHPSTYFFASMGEISVLVMSELVAMCLSATTLVNIRDSQRGSCHLRGVDSRRHNTAEVQWWCLYMKILLLAGADYVFVLVFFLMDNILYVPNFCYFTMWDIYNMRGIEILFIFVLKDELWKLLRDKYSRKTLSLQTSSMPM